VRYVIGDVHGCGGELVELLRLLPDDAEVFCVGDLFDRGPDPVLVWQWLHLRNVRCTLGNHDRKMLQYLAGQRAWLPAHYHYAIGKLCSHGGPGFTRLVSFLGQLPLLIDLGGHLVVHAGADPQSPRTPDVSWNVYGNRPEDEKVKPTKRDRGKSGHWWGGYRLAEPVVVYGHVCQEDCTVRYTEAPGGKVNTVGVDTRTAWGGPLTAYCLETGGLVQYRSGRAWVHELQESFKATPTYVPERADRPG
jgi:diadenosine tetraphosphatase ApaH/serine/threonine PP2A family protein phosphatase